MIQVLLVVLVVLALLCIALWIGWRRAGRLLAIAQSQIDDLSGRFVRAEAEAMRLQTVRRDLVANISHELRTPLASIKLLVETLESGALHDETVAVEFLRKIGQETEHLIGMTQELLDLARLEAAPATRPSSFDPAVALAEVVERLRALAQDKGLTVSIRFGPTLPPVWADREQVGRVFVNLLNNAIKFTPEGGTVTIGGRAEKGFVAIIISDTGPGIPAGEEARIFERFYKADTARQRGGTGLGLSIARHIVEAQGGQIWARNNEGGGACFTFTLPLANAPQRVLLQAR